jgi:hypothetical protein
MSPLRVTHVTPQSVVRRASQSDLWIDNGKYYGSAREPMAFQRHVYQPIGRYGKSGIGRLAGDRSAGVQLNRSAGSADRDVSARVGRNRL